MSATAAVGFRASRAWVAGTVAVLMVVAVGGCGSSDDKPTSSRVANVTTTTAPPTTTAAPATTAPPTTTARTEPSPTEPPADATTESTAPPPECLNSTDPRCGPPHWESSLPANQPVHIDSVVVDPPHPIAGQNATVTIHWSDADADGGFLSAYCDGIGCNGGPAIACPILLHPPTGPWTPPPASPGAGTLVGTLEFPVAGTFTWSVRIATWNSAPAAHGFSPGRCTPLPDPYASLIDYSDSITVLPAFPSLPG